MRMAACKRIRSMTNQTTAGWCPIMGDCDRGCPQGPSRTQSERCARMIELRKEPRSPTGPVPENKSAYHVKYNMMTGEVRLFYEDGTESEESIARRKISQ